MIYGTTPVAPRICEQCESLREQLCDKWLRCCVAESDAGASGQDQSTARRAVWSPKCDVIVHASSAGYVQAVGAPGAATLASSLVDQEKGRISVRRIDVRGTDPNWQTAALPHELTHVVLADRFAGRRLAPWADEGMATLADPEVKQQRHLRDMRHAMSTRSGFRVVELLNMDDYPPPHRWAAFYGQSVSITKFLVERGRSDQFVAFVEHAAEHGYETALRDIYQIDGTAALEQAWIAAIDRRAGRDARTSRVGLPLVDAASRVAVLAEPRRFAFGASAAHHFGDRRRRRCWIERLRIRLRVGAPRARIADRVDVSLAPTAGGSTPRADAGCIANRGRRRAT